VLNLLLIDSFHDKSLISISIYIYIYTLKKMYCVKCRTMTNMADAQNFIVNIRGKCVDCGLKVRKMVTL